MANPFADDPDLSFKLVVAPNQNNTVRVVPVPEFLGQGPQGIQGEQGPVGPRGPEGPAVELLGVSGNNELEITGIENTTVIESVSINEWRWLKYMISISKISGGVNKFYATELTILIDNDNINVSESGTIDNDGDMGTISVSKNGSNLELIVTPLPNIRPITVRYARMGLKS
jgi:hypothetical protein